MEIWDFDYAFATVDEHGFWTVRDIWEGLEMAIFDTFEEAFAFMLEGEA